MTEGTLALWYKPNEDIFIDGHEPSIELHFNMWRELTGSKVDALDIGFRIKECHAINTLNLYVPGLRGSDAISDLSSVLLDNLTLTAVFNDTLYHDEQSLDYFAVKKDNKILFYVLRLDPIKDLKIIPLSETDNFVGSVIQFHNDFLSRVKKIGDRYLRFRIKLEGDLKSLFVTDFSQADRIFLSSFYTTDMIEFRLNERRNFPSILNEEFPDMKFPIISAIYFILIRDFNSELVRSHASFHKMRHLETHLWKNYISSLSSETPKHMLLYHWRAKYVSEPIEDFIALASFRTPKHQLYMYILIILLLGMSGNALENAMFAYYKEIFPNSSDLTSQLLIGLFLLILLILMYFLYEMICNFFRRP